MMDYYAVLGVGRDASQEEIKEAFRRRALECHPDQVADDEEETAREEFLRIRRAFEHLSDPQRRAAYDAADGEERRGGESGQAGPIRRRSYKKAWRDAQTKPTISVRRAVLDKVGGLSADYELIRRRTVVTVPLFSLLGMTFFLVEPGAIYASDVFLVDLFFCAAVGGTCGLILGYAWGYTDLFLRWWDEHS